MPTCRVLIVDDQRDVRRVLRAALETMNGEIQITDVPSGEEAILVISRQPVEVLIADVRLPGISGLELIARARVRNPNLRLVLITGLTDDKVRRQVEAARADAFFYKPVEIRAFLDTMQDLLGIAKEADTGQAAALIAKQASPSSVARFLQMRTAAVREELNAGMAALVDASGAYLSQDGRLPLLAGEWTAALEAARRLAAAPGNPLKEITYLSDGAFDFFIAPVSDRLWLVAGAVHRAWYSAPFGRLVDVLRAAVEDLRSPETAAERADYIKITGIEGAPPDSPRPVVSGEGAFIFEENHSTSADTADEASGSPAGDAAVSPDLDALLDILRDQAHKQQDANAFWDSAAQKHTDVHVRPDGLSFDQARQMGLAPDED